MASIRTRPRKDGQNTYTVNWRDPEQGLKSRTFTDKDKAEELKDFLDANGNSFKAAATAKRRKDSTSPTVANIMERHLDQLRKPQQGTIAKYRRMAAAHINDSDLGRTPVDQVDKEAVIRWLDGLTVSKGANQAPGGPLGRKSKQNVHALLSAAFRTAVDRKQMESNPARGISEADRNEAREPVYLSPEDLDLISERAPEPYQLFLRTLAKTGLRYNEATALRKRDVNVTGRRAVILVTRAWKAGAKGEEIGPPKTKKAKRPVKCGTNLSASLIAHMEGLAPDDLLFTRPSGEYLRNSWFHKEVWQPLVKELVAEGALDRQPWIHEIRHAVTTHLLERSIPVHEVQAHLGHEDPQTTLRVYARLGKGSGDAAADALD